MHVMWRRPRLADTLTRQALGGIWLTRPTEREEAGTVGARMRLQTVAPRLLASLTTI